jgi:hypothetical protein
VILSHAWKFIFIKGKKIAGTSVEIALSAICGPEDIITPILPRDEIDRLKVGRASQNYSDDRAAEQHYIDKLKRSWNEGISDTELPQGRYYNHMPLREVLQAAGESSSEYRVFAVERSPYSKILSWANMRVASEACNRGLSGAILGRREEITAFLADEFGTERILRVKNIDLYRGLDGNVRADVLRYAALPSDLTSYLHAFGVSPVAPLPHAKMGLLADTLDPKDYFSRRQLDEINELYSEEFETFGYRRI